MAAAARRPRPGSVASGRCGTTPGRSAAACRPEDLCGQSMPDASPGKWHLAHTTWFFETFLLEGREPAFRPFHPRYRYLFNSYYDAVGPRHARPRRGLLTRPPLEEVLAYRQAVDERVEALLRLGETSTRTGRRCWSSASTTSSSTRSSSSPTSSTSWRRTRSARPPTPRRRRASARPRRSPSWSTPAGWWRSATPGRGSPSTTRGPRHRVFLEPFALATRLVTNREWLAFVEDGGYRRPELWLSEGFAAVQAEGWWGPLHWEREGEAVVAFTLHGARPLELEAPVVHVSFHEADAYARWAGARLPSEEEWEVVAASAGPDAFARPQGAQPLQSLCTLPAAGSGLRQLTGEVWQWTRSAYGPYPRFRPAPGALGEYNGKFMCNQVVLRGGSCATPPGHTRPTYRNFFHPPDRWQFTGVRLAREA